MRGFFFFCFKKKKREKIFHTCTMNMRGYFFHPSKKKQRDLDYQACSSDMVGYFFQGFNFFFLRKKYPRRVILPYTGNSRLAVANLGSTVELLRIKYHKIPVFNRYLIGIYRNLL